MSHLTFTLLMAALVSGAASLPGDRSPRDRFYVAAYVFVAHGLVAHIAPRS